MANQMTAYVDWKVNIDEKGMANWPKYTCRQHDTFMYLRHVIQLSIPVISDLTGMGRQVSGFYEDEMIYNILIKGQIEYFFIFKLF